MNIWLILLIAWLLMAVVMALLWLVQLKRGDAGIVDVAWAAGIGILAILFFFMTDGWLPRQLMLLALACFWAFRLSGYLLYRVLTMPEDGRYQTLRESWGPSTQRNLFIFFQVQATWSVMFAVPILIAMRNDTPSFTWLDGLGLLVMLASFTGESIADRQLAAFRNDPSNKGKVCKRGLWRYSRHPNYFFEWCHWFGYVLIGWAAPYGWVTLMGPAVMLLFLTKVTGIPPTEAQAIKSRGDAYREYQRTTSAFFPWPPKESASDMQATNHATE